MTNVIKTWANNYETITLEEGTPEVLAEMTMTERLLLSLKKFSVVFVLSSMLNGTKSLKWMSLKK